MDILIRYGLSIEEIKNMIDSNPEINNIEEKELENIIKYLHEIGCSKKIIINILITNPFFITRSLEDIIKEIEKLKEIGMNHIELLLDKNPYLLNFSYKEIDSIERYQRKLGLSDKEIENLIYEESDNWI